MELEIFGRNLGITDRFREYVTGKSEKISRLSDRALALEVKVSRHREKADKTSLEDRVELTLIGPGPVVRSEATGFDKYSAFDTAQTRLVERIRRVKDRRKVHRGGMKRPTSLREASSKSFGGAGIVPAPGDLLEKVRTGTIPIVGEMTEENADDVYGPVVIRRKVFQAMPMSVDDALYRMELVGHDFYLFVDSETGRPSVVYRRKGWDYGLIALGEEAA
ncbi:MAG TPA: ribosome-associated translation inhibitor RaiA [Microbacteriaceae bacterium]|nr:ribosome-associated translation inhibitor RaiA [Microbacteriaceae bacterium]